MIKISCLTLEKFSAAPSKYIYRISSFLFLFAGCNLSTPAFQIRSVDDFKNFNDWCENRLSLPQETRLTIESLLKRIGSFDCKQADKSLGSLTTLDLSQNPITDLQPLSVLTSLTHLTLDINPLKDFKPLSQLTNLTHLTLRSNPVTFPPVASPDLATLSPLIHLTHLEIR